MKCENCGNHEASCHYRVNINGEVSEMHLCPDCAGEQGLLRTFDHDPFESLLENFFSPRFSLGGTMLRTLPRVRAAAADPVLAKRREKEALRFQLEEAVKSENYEKAIELRDKLRDMDNAG